jgi:hypothetical protein
VSALRARPQEHTFLPDAAGHAHGWCDRADGETPTPYATTAQTTPTDVSVEARIRAAYDSLASRPGAWLRHTDVRRELGDLPTEVLDEAFRALSRAQDVDMMPESNQKILTEQDRRNAVWVGGMDTHLIAIGIRSTNTNAAPRSLTRRTRPSTTTYTTPEEPC